LRGSISHNDGGSEDIDEKVGIASIEDDIGARRATGADNVLNYASITMIVLLNRATLDG
jgi:hypothetical protein